MTPQGEFLEKREGTVPDSGGDPLPDYAAQNRYLRASREHLEVWDRFAAFQVCESKMKEGDKHA